MSDYEFLTVDTVASYIESRPVLASRVDTVALASVEEIGDGNLNLVFLVKDRHGRGLCLKQALPYVRMTGEAWPMTPDRARHEVESLRAHHALIPDHVVEVFDYHPERYIIAMEDLSDHRVWRGALNEGLRHDGAAEAMGAYVGAVAFGTSAFGLERHALADAVSASVNPALCTITEDLVFTEPLVDAGRNSVLPANEKDAAELAADDAMVRAMGRAKWLFMTQAEALIHGDLHTGSVMVRAVDGSSRCDSVKAFDSEFAFYGPVAFDLGALWGNYAIAAARALALGQDERAAWALGLVQQTWDGFEGEFRRRWPSRLDARVWRDDTLQDLLREWENEAWLFAAAKMSRRIVGAAKTADIETLPEELREGAARGVLRAARTLVRHSTSENGPRVVAGRVGEVLAEHCTR
ncbi:MULTISPECIES: S-methyl-5-thioribose kinase [unclassified Nocardioides]|uniref:S-methyl-5-thioribose kinase n=1 Tax=unclassified Nocardioides TaxID=2615069 RepID=UPI001305265C|nr:MULTISPECIES: S-methyl-5-thioribose kinase [unclassified Nocardioides]